MKPIIENEIVKIHKMATNLKLNENKKVTNKNWTLLCALCAEQFVCFPYNCRFLVFKSSLWIYMTFINASGGG